uniref:Transposase n=1 Tax=Salmonella enterica subsp. salamae TaxID=59202 RepID=I3W496_SALER|nr:hypothetical protein [Salmonella enterica subsp. salamae]
MKILSRHSDTARAFAYLLKQWDALNVYCKRSVNTVLTAIYW